MSNDSMAPAWVVVIAHVGTEESVERGLRNAGYRVRLPMRRELRWPHGTGRAPRAVLAPAWPGYVFVQDWRGWPQETVTGAIGLMRRDGFNVELPTADILEFDAWEAAGVFDDARLPQLRRRCRVDLAVGDTVSFHVAGRIAQGRIERLSRSGQAFVREVETGWVATLDAATLEKL